LAIAGIACRFPGGVRDADSFWRLLIEGGDGISVVPAERWDADRFYSRDAATPGKSVTRWGGFVDGIERFDAEFFGISPREALRMDPQQRWLLELAWEALEDARCPPSSLRGSPTSVFVGISNSDYGKIQHDFVERLDGYTNIGNSLSLGSNRISYHFDLKGPSATVDTACSSGLVALDLACRSLWAGECGAALAGAANLILLPEWTIGFSKAGMLSPTGRCHAFDARADGYVRGEGVAMLFVKPLRRAIEDGNRVYATVRASHVNQDGRTSSLPVPGFDSQREMTRRTLLSAGIPPARVVYVEAHGTGTPVGDPIEARALGEVLRDGRPEDAPCLIGSVKSNIGHLETAAGLVGAIKGALVLKHGIVPGNVDFQSPNPTIPFGELGLKVATEPCDLPAPDSGRPVVLVNSFGFGGTNAQVVLESAPPEARDRGGIDAVPRKSVAEGRPLLLPLSARGLPALKASAARYGELLADFDGDLSAFCASAALQRDFLSQRLVVAGADAGELSGRLLEWAADDGASSLGEPGPITGEPLASAEPGPVFVFTGQGAQWWGMGRVLRDREPVFAQTLARVDAALAPLAPWSLLEEIGRSEEDSRIDDTSVAQPALFALQAGLVDLWRSWGVEPAAVVGHSVGEVAAAYAAGIFTLEQASELVCHRSRLQAETGGGGGMLAVALSEEEALERLQARGGRVELAAVNGPGLVTLGGEDEALQALQRELEAEGRFVRRLRIDYAFHTRQMDSIKGALRAALDALRPERGAIPFVSTVVGETVPGGTLDADYWWRNVREPVRFSQAIEALVREGRGLFLEVGPHPALEGAIRESLAASKTAGRVLHSLNRGADDSLSIASNFAGLHLAGVPVDWSAYLGASPDPDLRLPSYPWQGGDYWLESPASRSSRLSPEVHPLLGIPKGGPSPQWELRLDPSSLPYLQDHRFWGRIVFPAAAYAEIGLAVGRLLNPEARCAVEDLEFQRILVFSGDEGVVLRTEFEEAGARFRVSSRSVDSEQWTLHASGRIVPLPGAPEQPGKGVDLSAIRQGLAGHVAHWDLCEAMTSAGYEFGPRFQQIEQIRFGPGEALAEIVVPPEIREDASSYRFHPAVLDACFQAAGGTLLDQSSEGEGMILPGGLGSVQGPSEAVPAKFWVHARLRSWKHGRLRADLDCYDPSGKRFAALRDFVLERLQGGSEGRGGEEFCYRFDWEPEPEAGRASGSSEPGPSVEPGLLGPGERVILLGDGGGVGEALAGSLRSRGAALRSVPVACAGARLAQALDEAAADLGTEGPRPLQIVHLWALDHPDERALSPEALSAAQGSGVLSCLRLAQWLHAAGVKARVLVGMRASSGGGEQGVAKLASAPMLGFLRTVAGEGIGVAWRAVLLEGGEPGETVSALLGELGLEDSEGETAYFEGRRHRRRLQRFKLAEVPPRTRALRRSEVASRSCRIENERPGWLEGLSLNECSRREPGPGEIEVEVACAGVNFRDLMKALAIYPGEAADSARFGDDFAGTVLSVGSGVSEFKPGDEVFGLGEHCFRSHLVADRLTVFPKPSGISSSEAATLPTVFLTAHHALCRLARLRAGESVLIHAAAGGVGLAAIQVARSLGLEIYATAGTEEKREALREMGIELVMDSRNWRFAEEILERRGGRGVDAVLNSLAGEFIPKSLSVLAPFGRFIEIGKVDIYAKRQIGLYSLRRNIAYFVVDMAEVFAEKPPGTEELVREVGGAFSDGSYRPLRHRVFRADAIQEAFRFMAQGRHFGKLVLDFQVEGLELGATTEKGRLFSPGRTYLVAGGAGGFGLEVAKWLAENGARHLALLSRSGPGEPGAAEAIARLESDGVRVADLRVDVADGGALREAVRGLECEMPPAGGVVHAAMVLEDRFVPELDEESFHRALDPKMLGAWNLHEATLHRDLEFFAGFSSFASVVGSARQANYNAGNTFLDELVRYRRTLGLPGLSINWGALSGAGYAERNRKTLDYLELAGVRALTVAEALGALEALLRRPLAQAMAARVDWQALTRIAPAVARNRLFSSVAASGGREGGTFLLPLLLAAAPDQQREMVEEFLAVQIAAVLGSEADSIDRDTPVTGLGLDSLMTVELLNRIEGELRVNFPIGSILSGPSISDLAVTLLGPLLAAARLEARGAPDETD